MINIAKTEKGEIEYCLKGAGPVVLFVHGGHAKCTSDLSQDNLAERGFSVLTPSRPGYGATPVGSAKTAKATADLFAALIKKLNIDKVSVIGISAGGPAAIEFAAAYPELTEKLVLEAAVAKLWFHKLTVQYYATKIIFHPKRQRKFWDGLAEKLYYNEEKTLKSNLKRFTKLKPKDYLSKLSERDIQALKTALVTANDSGEGFKYDVEHRAKSFDKITCPTLIIHSKNDGCLPFSHAEYAHKRIRNSQLYEAPACSHFICIGPGSEDVLNKRADFLAGKAQL